jgi:hypothetical protein
MQDRFDAAEPNKFSMISIPNMRAALGNASRPENVAWESQKSDFRRGSPASARQRRASLDAFYDEQRIIPCAKKRSAASWRRKLEGSPVGQICGEFRGGAKTLFEEPGEKPGTKYLSGQKVPRH